MSGRGRNRKGDPDIEDLQTQIRDLCEQLQESEAAMEEASEEASRNDSIIKELMKRVQLQFELWLKHRDLEAELEEKNNQLPGTSCSVWIGRLKQAMRNQFCGKWIFKCQIKQENGNTNNSN